MQNGIGIERIFWHNNQIIGKILLGQWKIIDLIEMVGFQDFSLVVSKAINIQNFVDILSKNYDTFILGCHIMCFELS